MRLEDLAYRPGPGAFVHPDLLTIDYVEPVPVRPYREIVWWMFAGSLLAAYVSLGLGFVILDAVQYAPMGFPLAMPFLGFATGVVYKMLTRPPVRWVYDSSNSVDSSGNRRGAR